ncbi:MAG: hypothetical protein H6736_11725 [Alphaproteobacteria bacterium]|nr:hypothetical protein [Alphaproteobacteria bacterium]MCB9692472.1 hypothetical protein [Alphaproteobacteria bacterium]
MLLLPALLGCAGSPDPIVQPTSVPVQTGQDPIDLPGGLHGTAPAEALPLPVFSATANDGTTRGPEALQGHVTVMWFLPAANTGG